MKLVSRTVLFSLIVIGLAISDASSSDDDVRKNSHTIESTSRLSPSLPITDSSASTSKSSIVTEPLPSDNASFETIRKRGKVYVDKTGILEYLLDDGNKLFFFTRPRRFGKSLLAKMMNTFFRGEQPSLFEGLQIGERGNIVHNETIFSAILRSLKRYFFRVNNKWVKYPVIYLDLSDSTFSNTGTWVKKLNQFETNLKRDLEDIARSYGVDSTRPGFRLTPLIRDLHEKFSLPVIILIDEYDAPVNKALHGFSKSRKLASGMAANLNDMFVEIKASTRYLRFVWVTGVTKLGLPVLESGPNSFVDVTLTKELAAAVGFTKDEVTSYFKSHIEVFSNIYERKFKEGKLMEKLLETYDGYRFSINSEIRVFNPISILGSFKNNRLDSYWKATGSLTYIVRRMFEGRYTISSFRKLKRSREFLFKQRNMIIQEIPLDIYMLFTGYLKIDSYDEKLDTCVLTYANSETEQAICDSIRSYIPSEKKLFEEAEWLNPSLRKAMTNEKMSEVAEILNRVGFPNYHIASNDSVNENEVTQRLLAVLQTADVLSEETRQFFFGNVLSGMSTEGDIDITTHDLPTNFVIEVKCEMAKKASSASDGIKQLIEYATKTEKKRISFIEALNDLDQVNLLSLHFKESYGGHMDEWVFLPYQGGRLRLDKLEASSQELLDRVKNMVSTMNIDPMYIV